VKHVSEFYNAYITLLMLNFRILGFPAFSEDLFHNAQWPGRVRSRGTLPGSISDTCIKFFFIVLLLNEISIHRNVFYWRLVTIVGLSKIEIMWLFR